MNRPFISFAKYISALFSSQSLSILNKKCDIYLHSDQDGEEATQKMVICNNKYSDLNSI